MNKRAFGYLISAQTISVLGDTFGLLAIEWLVYQMTGSYLAMGTLAAAFAVPEFVVRLLGAPLIDRVNRTRLMALLDLIRCGAFALPVLLGSFGELQLWHLYVTAVVTGSCAALFNPASMAVIPAVVKGEQLVRANSLMDASMTGAVMVGPLLAGTWIAFAGPMPSLAMDACSFALSAILIFLLSRQKLEQAPTKRTSNGGLRAYAQEALDGLRFFRQVPALMIIMSLVSVKNMGSVAFGTMLLPFAVDILHASALQVGVFTSVSAIGFLCGSLLVAWVGDVKMRRLPMLGSLIVQGVLIIAISQTTTYWIALVLYGVITMSGPFFGSFSSAIYGRIVPSELRGRVMSVRLLVGGGLQPVGAYGGGVVAAAFGIPAMLLTAGLLPAVLAIGGFLIPALKGIDGDLTVIPFRKSEHAHLNQTGSNLQN